MGEIAYKSVDALKKAIRGSNVISSLGRQKYIVWENKAIREDYEFTECECDDNCWCKRHRCTGHYVIKEMTFDHFLETYVHLWVPPNSRANVRAAVLKEKAFRGWQRNAVSPLNRLMKSWDATIGWPRQHRKCGLCNGGVPLGITIHNLYEAKMWSQLFYDSLVPFDSDSRRKIVKARYTDPISDYTRMNRELFEDLRQLASRANLSVPELRGLDEPWSADQSIVRPENGQPFSRVVGKMFYRP